MAAAGKVTVRKVEGNLIVSDESGESYTFPGPSERPLLLDMDPRIDLTKPISDQAQRLTTRDKASAARRGRRVEEARRLPPALKQGEPVDASLLIEGFGALKGCLTLPDDIDWTRPIYAQVISREKRRTPKSIKTRKAA